MPRGPRVYRKSYCPTCKGTTASGRPCMKPVCKESTQYCYIHYMQAGTRGKQPYNCPKCLAKDLNDRPCQIPVCNQDPSNQYCWIHWKLYKSGNYPRRTPVRYRPYGRR